MSSLALVETLLTVEEALEHLRISRSKLHELVRKGEISAVKFGTRTLFRPSSLQTFIESNETRVEPARLKRDD